MEKSMIRKLLSLLPVALMLPLVACANPPKAADLSGTWKCGPTEMQGPGFTVTVSETTTNSPAGTFTTDTTTVIAAPGKEPLTLLSRSSGKWELAGDVLRTHFERAEFLSASDPSISHEEGQKAEDDQLKNKSTYEARIIGIEGGRYRSVPVNPMYKEAAVESHCART
jgi:hypothetical protein